MILYGNVFSKEKTCKKPTPSKNFHPKIKQHFDYSKRTNAKKGPKHTNNEKTRKKPN